MNNQNPHNNPYEQQMTDAAYLNMNHSSSAMSFHQDKFIQKNPELKQEDSLIFVLAEKLGNTAIFILLVSRGLLSTLNASILKTLSTEYFGLELLLVRSIICFFIFHFWGVKYDNKINEDQKQNKKELIIRSFIQVTSDIIFFLSIQYLCLATSLSILYSSIALLVVMKGIYKRDFSMIDNRQYISFILAIFGVIFILISSSDQPQQISAVLAFFAAAVINSYSKAFATQEIYGLALQKKSQQFALIASVIGIIVTQKFKIPSIGDFLALILLSITHFFAILIMFRTTQIKSISNFTNFAYSIQLCIAISVDAIYFQAIPNLISAVGTTFIWAGIIYLSCLLN